MKDKRDAEFGKKKKEGKEPSSSNIQNRQLFFLIWAAGLVIVIIGAFIGMWQIYVSAFMIFFFAMGFGIHASKELLETRAKIYRRMFEISQSKLGTSAEHADNPEAVIRVLEWSDPLKPSKVEFDVPTTFGQEGEENFLKQYNQVFGNETAWVPDNDVETGKPGWNYDDGKATFRAVPPLPTMAPWLEHYINGEGVAWSFFPIALGVENGIELVNPNSGETENVLGFDLSGEQSGIGKKFGIKVGGEITTSPMAFVGGGTGGGKSLSEDTLVFVIRSSTNI